jgi:hypothetical protein
MKSLFFPQIETYIYENAFEDDDNKKVKLAGNKVMCDCNTAQSVKVSLSCMYSSEQVYQPYFSDTTIIQIEGKSSVSVVCLREINGCCYG